MPNVLFQGMCVFGVRENSDRVEVLMPTGAGDTGDAGDAGHGDHGGAHAAIVHKATLIADVRDVDLGNSPKPDELGITADGQQLAIWLLGGKTLTLTSLRDRTLSFDTKDVLNFSELHKNDGLSVVRLRDTATAELVGGSIKTSEVYPVFLEVIEEASQTQREKPRKMAEALSWSAGEASISLDGEAITLNKKDATVSIANVAAVFSNGFGGLVHFSGYYSILNVKKEHRLALAPDKKMRALRVGGGNCIPPGTVAL